VVVGEGEGGSLYVSYAIAEPWDKVVGGENSGGDSLGGGYGVRLWVQGEGVVSEGPVKVVGSGGLVEVMRSSGGPEVGYSVEVGGPVKVTGSGGPVEVPGSGGLLEVPSSGGPVEILGSGGPVEVSGSEGPVEISRSGGPMEVVGAG
jgi:hypothetical protein